MPRAARAPARRNIGLIRDARQPRDGKDRATPGRSVRGGLWQATEQTRFKKGRSGNPRGRPRKKPDLYSELTKVLRENVTVTIDGQPEKDTVQQALLLRLRDQALRGELWAQKLLQKVVAALPESESGTRSVDLRGAVASYERLMKDSARKSAEAGQDLEKGEAGQDPVEPENDE